MYKLTGRLVTLLSLAAMLSGDIFDARANPIGNIYQAGSTWYDLQHNATAGKMIGVDNAGFVNVVWMKGMDDISNQRYAYYNVWDPQTQMMMYPGGVRIDSFIRSGFISLALTPGGWVFPAFHALMYESGPHTSAGMDWARQGGTFSVTQPAYVYEAGLPLAILWPKIAVDPDSVVHVVSTQNLISGSGRIFYSRGVPWWDGTGHGGWINWQPVATGGDEFLSLDTVRSVSPDIACSKISNRVAIAYTRLRPGAYVATLLNSDLYLILSEDGGQNWSAPANLTEFADVDSQRAFTDVSLIFDAQDDLHIAFTTSNFWDAPDQTYAGSSFRARIWHWSEADQDFSIIASDWAEGSYLPGAGILNIGRPSLCLDPVTGFLYCSYQKNDQAWPSWALFPNGDAWVTASTDGGRHWSIGRNVSDTHPTSNFAPAGESASERDITLADHVTYAAGTGYLHLFWELDLDAGSWPNVEGTAQDNPVYYQRIIVDDIPLSPLVQNVPLHDFLPPVSDVVMLLAPATQSFSLHWTRVPGANQYALYGSTSLSDLFNPENHRADVADTTYQCAGCLATPEQLEYFGLVARSVPVLAAQTRAESSRFAAQD